jgi:hypothetical protein
MGPTSSPQNDSQSSNGSSKGASQLKASPSSEYGSTGKHHPDHIQIEKSKVLFPLFRLNQRR